MCFYIITPYKYLSIIHSVVYIFYKIYVALPKYLNSSNDIVYIITMVFQRRLKTKSGTYLVEVESYRQNGKIKQRYVRYIGKEVDGKKILSSSISNIEIESVKVYGPLMVLNQIAQEINLSKILGEYGNEILSMVYAHCVEPKSVNQMESWFEKTDLNFILDLHSITE